MITTPKINATALIVISLIPFFYLFQIVKDNAMYLNFLSFGVLFLFLILISLFNNIKHKFKFSIGDGLFSSFILFYIIILNYNNERVGFSSYLIVLYLIVLCFNFINIKLDISSVKKSLTYIIITYFLVSLVLTFFPQYYGVYGLDLRYIGLSTSPTVFGIVSLMLYIVFIGFLSDNFVLKIFLYILLIYLLMVSGSRINLIVGLLIPLYLSFINYKKLFFKYNKILYLIILITLLLVYPLYSTLKVPDAVDYLNRISSGDSDRTRFYYSTILFTAIENGNLNSLFFGHGSNASLALLGDESHKPHNDYLRIIYDYGIFFFIFFFISLFNIFKKNKYTSFLVLIYLFSFYHNMIFDMYIFMLLFFISKLTYKRLEHAK